MPRVFKLRTMLGIFYKIVAFSPDGRTLASGSWDETVRFWDAATGTHKTTLTEHTEGISNIAFSPDGRTFASSSTSEDKLRLWDAITGTHKAALIVKSENNFTLVARRGWVTQPLRFPCMQIIMGSTIIRMPIVPLSVQTAVRSSLEVGGVNYIYGMSRVRRTKRSSSDICQVFLPLIQSGWCHTRHCECRDTPLEDWHYSGTAAVRSGCER